MILQLTPERRRRVENALSEVNRKVEREMGYSEDLRNHDEVARLNEHAARLQGYLDQGFIQTRFDDVHNQA